MGTIDNNVLDLVEQAVLIPDSDKELINRKFDQMKLKDLMSTLINFKDDGTFYKNNAQATGGINFENAYNDFNVKNKWISNVGSNNEELGFFTNSYNTKKTDEYLILPYPTGNPLSLSQPLIIDFGELVYINTMDIKSSNLLELSKTTDVETDNGVDIDKMQTNFLDNSGNDAKIHAGKQPDELCTLSCQHPEYKDTIDKAKIIGLGTQSITGYGGAGSVNPNGSCVCYEKEKGLSPNIGTITLYLDSNMQESHTGTITDKSLDTSNLQTIGKVGRIMKITPSNGKILNINDIKFTGFKYNEGSQYVFSAVPYMNK